ncbi:hypothetical protein BYT27DRAFT_7196504, partial [Phlegmacium glaucopus]
IYISRINHVITHALSSPYPNHHVDPRCFCFAFYNRNCSWYYYTRNTLVPIGFRNFCFFFLMSVLIRMTLVPIHT